MKKVLLALVFTSFSICAFASINQNATVDGPVSCMAGMTSCGTTYMVCFSEPREVSDEQALSLWDMMDSTCP